MEKTTRRLPIVERDEWLQPVEAQMNLRHERYERKMADIGRSAGSLVDYANGYRYFGWQWDDVLDGWWLREWLPGAHDVYVFGDFNNWQRTEIRMQRDAHGVWSAFFPEAMYRDRLRHGSLYKLHVHGDNGWKDRIPAYATRVVQDEATKNYTAQFWAPEPFDWQGDAFDASKNGSLMIYEAHVGMAQEKEGVGTYREFTEKILPIIKKDGYNAVQLMAIAEHPYYGSFGYHVSSFFAPASRCGTPEELKELIRRAHELGLAVIMDLVHAHYVKNLNEGINSLDGTDHLYSPPGDAGWLIGCGWVVTAVQNGTLTFPAGMEGTVSVFSSGDAARGVTLRGLLYEVTDATLTCAMPLGVSNSFTGAEASVHVADGTVFVLWQGDALPDGLEVRHGAD